MLKIGNWQEILESKTLRYYGSALAFIHVISAWLFSSYRIDDLARENPFPICYPGMEGCEQFRFFSAFELRNLMIFYGVIALFCAISFLISKLKKVSLPLLLFLCLFKTFIQLSDYRIATNYHFLAQVITFIYLSIPNRITTMAILIPGIYFCAGLLKINVDWLSGATLIKPSIIQGPMLSILLIYVLILEIFIVWLIYSNKKWLRALVLFQLIAFHIYSWHIVDYPYPTFMFCVLSFFIFTFNVDYEIKKHLPRVAAIMGGLCLFQLSPYIITKDPGLDGRSRIFSFNMMDVTSVCERTIELETLDHKKQSFNIPFKIMRPRLLCDPQLTSEVARAYCKTQKGTLLISQKNRRSTEVVFTEVLNYSMTCPR